MNKVPTPTPWYQPWLAGRRVNDADAADLGTAFGLDMSVEHWQDGAAETPVAALSEPGWLARWATRRKQAL
jgi:hypothetical protein